MFKFYLDGNLVSDPVNWEDFTETIERNDDIKGILPKYDIKLNFNAGGYKYLYDQYKTNGYCKLIALRIDYKCSNGAFKTELDGYIFLSDVKFHLNRCLAECSVIDNNYGARIFNNKKIKAQVNVGYSKNGVAIDPATAIETYLFNPVTGDLSIVNPRLTYRIWDVFRFLIDFMTDGLVGFESDYFSYDPLDPGDKMNLHIVTGKELREIASDDHPVVSFQDVFTEVNKKYPIGFAIIKGSSGNPVMKIENEDYFYNSTNSISVENIADLSQSFTNEKLYSSVKFGEEIPANDPLKDHFPQIRFLGFTEEEYQIQGECNIDKELDLSSVFLSDSNKIERLAYTDTSDTQWDDEIFFLETEGLGGVGARAYSSLLNPDTLTLPYYYNGDLTNNKVAERYNLQGEIAFYLGDNDEGFQASKTSDQLLDNYNRPLLVGTITPEPFGLVKITFQDDSTSPNYDAGGNFNTATSRYVAPADGVYSFKLNSLISLVGCNDPSDPLLCNTGVQYTLILRKYSSGSSLLQEQSENFPSGGSGLFYFVSNNISIFNSIEKTFYMQATDYIEAYISGNMKAIYNYINACGNLSLKADLTDISTIATHTGGGIYEANIIPKNYYVSKFEFEKPLSHDAYNTLKQDLSKGIEINNGPTQKGNVINRQAWIRRMKRNFATSNTEWELVSNINAGF